MKLDVVIRRRVPLAATTLLVLGLSTMALTQPRLHSDLRARLDSLRLTATTPPIRERIGQQYGHRKRLHPGGKVASSQAQGYVIDTAIARSNLKGTTRYLYSFNAQGRTTCELIQKLAGDLWVDSVRYTSTYDADGNRLSLLTAHWLDGQWVDSRRERWTYDLNGREISSLDELWSNGQRVAYEYSAKSYDANGNLIFKYSEYRIGGPTYRETFTYDKKGNCLTHLYETWENSRWEKLFWWTYTYDANGKELSCVREYWVNGNLSRRERWTNVYDANGNAISSLHEHWENNTWVKASRNTMTYDEDGNILTDLYEIWRSDQWVKSFRQTWTYDTGARLLTYLGEGWSGEQWENYYRGVYTYDEDGNILTDLYEFWSSGQMYWGHRVTYTYDTKGKMFTDLREEWFNGQWESIERHTRTYDALGNLTSWWNHKWGDGSWTPGDGGYFGIIFSDSVGNRYAYDSCYNIDFTYRVILTGVSSGSSEVPAAFSLSQNYPNPFNPTTTIRYALPQRSHVTLTVYNTLGQHVATLVNGDIDAGDHSVQLDATRLASGVYFSRLTAGPYVEARTMILMK